MDGPPHPDGVTAGDKLDAVSTVAGAQMRDPVVVVQTWVDAAGVAMAQVFPSDEAAEFDSAPYDVPVTSLRHRSTRPAPAAACASPQCAEVFHTPQQSPVALPPHVPTLSGEPSSTWQRARDRRSAPPTSGSPLVRSAKRKERSPQSSTGASGAKRSDQARSPPPSEPERDPQPPPAPTDGTHDHRSASGPAKGEHHQQAPLSPADAMATEPDEKPPRRRLRKDAAAERNAAALALQNVSRMLLAAQKVAQRRECNRTCLRSFQARVDSNFYDDGVSLDAARQSVCLHDCDACRMIEFPCPFRDCPHHTHAFPSRTSMLRHIAEHPATAQAAFVERCPQHRLCKRCHQLVVTDADCHDRCFLPLMFQVSDLETDEARDQRFEGQFLSQFDNAYFTQMDSVLTMAIVRGSKYHTVTHPRMDDPLAGWIRMGWSRLVSAWGNPATPRRAKSGAFKLMLITPALLFHQPRRMQSAGAVHGIATTVEREINHNATLWLLKRVPELVEHMLREHAALCEHRDSLDPTPGDIINAAVSREKFDPASEALSSVAEQKERVQLLPSSKAFPAIEKVYAFQPAPQEGYSDGKAFPDADCPFLQETIDAIPGPLLDGPTFMKALGKISSRVSGGASSAKREHYEFIFAGNDELAQQFALATDRALRTGAQGLPHSDPFAVEIRNMILGKPVFGLSKLGKPDQVRSVSPASTLSKAIVSAVLHPATKMLTQFLKPSQVAYKRSDAAASFALLIQAGQDMSRADFERYLQQSDPERGAPFATQHVAVLFDIVKMHPRMRRRFIYEEISKVLRGTHQHVHLRGDDTPRAVQDVGAWSRLMFALLYNYGSPVLDWHQHDDTGLISALRSMGGGCIGQEIAGILAYTGFQFITLAVEAVADGAPPLKAKTVSYADNGAILGQASHALQLFRRMVEFCHRRDIAEFQELTVLRTAHAPKGQSSESLSRRLRQDVMDEITKGHCGATIAQPLFDLLHHKQTTHTCDGVITVGIPVGTAQYRGAELLTSAKADIFELQTLCSLPAVGPQVATSYVFRSFMHRWVSRLKSQPPRLIKRPAAMLDDALARFVAQQSDFDRSSRPAGPPLPTLQKLMLRCQVSDGGMGIVHHGDRVDAGVYAVGIAGMVSLARDTKCQHLSDLILSPLTRQTKNKRSSQLTPGSVADGYCECRARRAQRYKDDVLPVDPTKLVPKQAPPVLDPAHPVTQRHSGRRAAAQSASKQLYGKLMAPVHLQNLKDLDAAGHSKSCEQSSVDRRMLNVREATRQVMDKGGWGAWWSIIPLSSALTIVDINFRINMSALLGFSADSLHSNLIGLQCRCHRKSIIDGHHFMTCPLAWASSAHHALRDNAAALIHDTRVAGTTVSVEPKGVVIGRQPTDRHGTDVLVVKPADGNGHALEVKTVNPSGSINQDKFRRDQQQQRSDPPRKTNSETGTHTHKQPVGRDRSPSETRPTKTIPALITSVEHNEDATLATQRGVQFTCVPALTTGAIHGQHYSYLQEFVPPAGDPDRDRLDHRYNLGWSCSNFRTYSYMSASVAIINTACIAARHAAEMTSRYYDVPGPSRSEYNWHRKRVQPTVTDLEALLEPFDSNATLDRNEHLLTEDRTEPQEHSPTATHDAVFTVTSSATDAHLTVVDGWF